MVIVTKIVAAKLRQIEWNWALRRPFSCRQHTVDDEVNFKPFLLPIAIPICIEHEQFCPRRVIGPMPKGLAISMAELVADMTAVVIVAVAAIVTAAAALAANRKERSRVLVPIPVRSRNIRR
ncbi:MAG: hypothetical protein ABWY49_00460 [Rhizobium sp.]